MQRLEPTISPNKKESYKLERWREQVVTPALTGRLPVPPTPLIGREQEMEQAVSIVRRPETRLLTLYGTGGVGKTRLALAVAAEFANRFSDGVFFVALDNISERSLLLSALCQSLELDTVPDESVLATLVGSMRDMAALIVLDGFEQLLSNAPLLADILGKCPQIKMLVTSRSVLNLRGEQSLPIQPLLLPTTRAGKRGSATNGIELGPAVELFVQRAQSVKPDFALDRSNAQLVAEICVRLDGLPLAIELAAARIKSLSPKLLLARLDKRLQILTGGAQDLPLRQQTLRNTIAWSYELLDSDEQALFRLLSIFAGGCTIDDAEAVCTDMAQARAEFFAGDFLDIVTSLNNKSLVRVVDTGSDESRLLMLETVREYARELLVESGEEQSVSAAHARYVLRLAEAAETELRSADQIRWLNKLERELGNLRAALEWSVVDLQVPPDEISERTAVGLRIAGALTRFWHSRSHVQEGLEWLNTLLSRTTGINSEVREQALRSAGRLLHNMGQVDQAYDHYNQALEIARERGDLAAVAMALVGLANVMQDQNEDAEALRAYQECLQIWTTLNSKQGIARSITNIGLAEIASGELDAAIAHLHLGAELFDELGDRERAAVTYDSLGRTYRRKGDLDLAEKYVRHGLAVNLEIEDQWNIAYGLVSLAEICGSRKEHRRAAQLLAAAEATYDNLIVRLDSLDEASYRECLQDAEEYLGQAEFTAAWTLGLNLNPEEAISDDVDATAGVPEGKQPRFAGMTNTAEQVGDSAGLSGRELEVLGLLSLGLSNAEISDKLTVSLYTVNAHLRNIYSKLNVSSRAAATRYALQYGIAGH